MLLTQTPFPRAPKRLPAFFIAAALLILCLTPNTSSAGLTIRQGYFWDPERQETFIPHGFAYQVWNPPVFATQTFAEVDYDLEAMQKAHANSLRVELVWESVEPTEGVYRWDQADHPVLWLRGLQIQAFLVPCNFLIDIKLIPSPLAGEG